MNKSIENIVRHSEFSEKEIEKYLVRRVRELGGICLKYSNPAEAGYPDRLAILPGAVTIFAEIKSKGRKPSKLQTARISALTAMGHSAFVFDSKGAVDEALGYYQDSLDL